MSIVTVTMNPCIDKTFTVDHVVPDRKLQARDVQRYPGGGGLNVARAIGRLGGRALALWSCGGPNGQLLSQLLEREHVKQRAIPIAGTTRENVIAYESSSDQQYRFGLPGPRLSAGELDTWARSVEGIDPPPAYMVLSGSLPPGVPADWYGRLIDASSEQTRVVVDTKGEALRRALRAGVFLIKPNVSELEEIVGHELDGDEAIERGAREIISRGASTTVLVSLGRAGALLITPDERRFVRAPTVRARSKVGAGDSMVGGLVHGLARGWELVDAVKLGVAAGTAAVMTEGTELCRGEDVRRLYACMSSEEQQAA